MAFFAICLIMTSTIYIATLYSILNYYAPCFAHFFINHPWGLNVHPLSSSPALLKVTNGKKNVAWAMGTLLS